MDRITPRRLDTLDGLRGLAILSVVIHHGCMISQETDFGRMWNQVVSLGYFGGELFLVMSGYFMTMSLLKVRTRQQTVRSVYRRRYIRLLPLYWLAFVVCSLLIPIVAAAATGKPLGFYLSAWPNLLLQTVFGTNISMLFDPAPRLFATTWTLCVQEQVYLAWIPLCLLLPERMLKPACIVMIVAAAILRIAAAAWPPANSWIHIMPVFRMDAIAIGSLVAILAAEKHVPRIPYVVRLAVLATVLWAVALAFIPNMHEPFWLATRYLALAGLGALWLLTGLNVMEDVKLGRVLAHPWLAWYGRRSYSIYLFHGVVQMALFFVANKLAGVSFDAGLMPRSWLTAAMGVVSIVALVPVAWLSHRFIEQPLEAWRKPIVPPAPETGKLPKADSESGTVVDTPRVERRVLA
jgi:peptidoglycan/LPS O-acetylase OafA/YrhL